MVILALLWLAPALAQTNPATEAPFGDAEQVSRDFEEISLQPEFRGLRLKKSQEAEAEAPAWLKKFLDWLGDLFGKTGTNVSGLGPLLQAVAYTVLAAICCLVIWLVVRAVNNYRERNSLRSGKKRAYEEGDADVPPGDLPADEYLRRAAELAEKGLFREAIGQLILGAMSQTERSGLIRFRRGLTHRDYLRALRARAMQHQAFRSIVAVYEPICFGRRPAEIEHFRTSLDGYQTGFRIPIRSDAEAAAKREGGL